MERSFGWRGQAVQKSPCDVWILVRRVENLLEADPDDIAVGLLREAEAAFRSVLDLDPSNADATRRLCRLGEYS